MCSSALSEKDLHCLKTNLLVVSGRRNATHCLLLFHLALSFMTHNQPLTFMLMTTYNTGFNWFTPCPWGISYMRKVSNGYSYTSNHYVMFKITKTPEKARRRKTRQGKIRRGSTQESRCPLVSKKYCVYGRCDASNTMMYYVQLLCNF